MSKRPGKGKRAEPVQLELRARTWGGRRANAGRPAGKRRPEPHRARPEVKPQHPLHITLKIEDDLPGLRSKALAAVVLEAIAKGKEREGFRVVHFCIQGRHLHLLAEADSKQALGLGMRGLGVRLARAINKKLGRRGRVFKERYCGRAKRTPTETRAAIHYVLGNARRHCAERGERLAWNWLDPLSSAAWFDGWRFGRPPPDTPRPVAAPRSWLLSVGWRKGGGPIDPNAIPGPTPAGVASRRRFRSEAVATAAKR